MFRLIEFSTFLPKFIKTEQILKVFETTMALVKFFNRNHSLGRETSATDTNLQKWWCHYPQMFPNILSFIDFPIQTGPSLIFSFFGEINDFSSVWRGLFIHHILIFLRLFEVVRILFIHLLVVLIITTAVSCRRQCFNIFFDVLLDIQKLTDVVKVLVKVKVFTWVKFHRSVQVKDIENCLIGLVVHRLQFNYYKAILLTCL